MTESKGIFRTSQRNSGLVIEIKLIYQDKTLTGIESKGHSGYSHRGNDIICAAVSALMQALILGIEDIAQCDIDEKIPLMRVMWPESEQDRISLLTGTIASSLKIIAQENPRYVKLQSEVRK